MDVRVSSVYNAYSLQPARGTAQTSLRTGQARTDADKLSLSAQAEDYQTARRALAATPDVRMEAVTRIQEMLNAGTYRVSSQDVASSIFQGLA